MRTHTDERWAIEVAVAVHTLKRTLEFGGLSCVRVA